MKCPTIIAATLIAGIPTIASASTPTTETVVQNFNVFYAPHDSLGPSQILQYSGPLTLRGVTIDWFGFAYSGLQEGSPDDTEEQYSQPYTGTVNFLAYSSTPGSNFIGATDSRPIAGTSDCTLSSCSVGGGAGGTYVEGKSNLKQWVGNGAITFDSHGSVSPFWCCGSGTSFYIGASGSVTYLVESSGVPEPASWAMMIAGFAAVGGAMRRRSQLSVQRGGRS